MLNYSPLWLLSLCAIFVIRTLCGFSFPIMTLLVLAVLLLVYANGNHITETAGITFVDGFMCFSLPCLRLLLFDTVYLYFIEYHRDDSRI